MKYYVYSHRRSGTHFLIETLNLNFGIGIEKKHMFYREEHLTDFNFYIARDIRDCIISNYHWWRTSGESVNEFKIADRFSKYSISEYIRGISEFDNDELISPLYNYKLSPEIFNNPLEYWCKHIMSFKDKENVFMITYKDLLEKYDESIISISNYINKPIDDIKKVDKLVGYHPRKGVVGEYKEVFIQEDLDYIMEKTKDVFQAMNWEY